MYTAFDKDELQQQAQEIAALIEALRPHPMAILQSRAKIRIMAAMSEDVDLVRIVTKADDQTLFWEIEGEIVEQKVSLMELPAS